MVTILEDNITGLLQQIIYNWLLKLLFFSFLYKTTCNLDNFDLKLCSLVILDVCLMLTDIDKHEIWRKWDLLLRLCAKETFFLKNLVVWNFNIQSSTQ